VQRKRFIELEKTRKKEILEELRSDLNITRSIVEATKSTTSVYNRSPGSKRNASKTLGQVSK